MESAGQKNARLRAWHPWFAWHPVEIADGQWAWLEMVECRRELSHDDWFYFYRARPSQFNSMERGNG